MIGSTGVAIRPYTLEDTRVLWEGLRESLPELKAWMPWCHEHFSNEESNAWLQVQVPAFKDGREFAFAIIGPDGQYLGACGLNQIDKANKRANLG